MMNRTLLPLSFALLAGAAHADSDCSPSALAANSLRAQQAIEQIGATSSPASVPEDLRKAQARMFRAGIFNAMTCSVSYIPAESPSSSSK